MLVYQHREQLADPARVLGALRRDAGELIRQAEPAHDRIVDLLVRFGELESAVRDAFAVDEPSWRRAALALGRSVAASAGRSGPAPHVHAFAAALAALIDIPAGRNIAFRTSEGFAYHALYPEAYLDAVHHYRLSRQADRVLVIGVRTIGAALSAVVGGALEIAGVTVTSTTVRPTGPPFARELMFEPAARRLVRRAIDHRDDILIVDEGPGLSGSTFLSVAEALRRAGAAARQVAFFPSWRPAPSQLRSCRARERWNDYASFVGHAPQADPGGIDISAGYWRDHLLAPAATRPPVHPQHEKRKALCGGHMRRFAGLGTYGHAVSRRAALLADAGFTPPYEELRYGFMSLSLVRGTPATCVDADGPLIDRMADYVAFLSRRCQQPGAASIEPLLEMTVVNTAEWLDGTAALAAERLLANIRGLTVSPVAVDGRMLPHEWIRRGDGRWLKVDAFDHHADDFYPGHTDAAWDLAGAMTEFRLDGPGAARLVARYAARAGDTDIARRLPGYRVTYLAFRLGYAAMAAESLDGTADGSGFRRLADRYGRQLQALLTANAPSGRETC